MQGYLRDKFKHHQAIASCFIHFLTHHMDNQSTLGLKTNVDKLEADVQALKARAEKKVSTEMFNRLDSKLQNLIRLNPCLKTRD
jgi:hypothetical protein